MSNIHSHLRSSLLFKKEVVCSVPQDFGCLSLIICVLITTLCDKVCQWLATGRWFSPDTPVSSTNKTDCHDITKISLKVVLNTITLTPNSLISWLNCDFLCNLRWNVDILIAHQMTQISNKHLKLMRLYFTVWYWISTKYSVFHTLL